MSLIRNIVLKKTTKTPHFHRVIGTVDFKGQGTVHEVADVNPFILMDDPPLIAKKGLPPFGTHPHHGLQVISLIWSGSIYSKLAHQEKETICHGPVSVSLFAGRGMAHEECTHTDDPCIMQQLIFLIPESAKSKPARTQLNSSGFFSTGDEGSEAFLACGKMFDRDAGLSTETTINVVFGKLDAKAGVTLKTFVGGCFVYVLEGELSINDRTTVGERTLAIVEDGDADLRLTAQSSGGAKYIFANGERIDEPWVKLLTHNGFLIAKDEAEALHQEQIVNKVGLHRYGQTSD